MRYFRPAAASLLTLCPTAALADHSGPGGGVATGGAINTASAGTLDEGHWAAGVRFAVARPERLSDAELLARDAAGIDAHSSRVVASASAGLSYGVTHDLTLSAELPIVDRVDIRAVDAGAAVNRGTSKGIGDVTMLAKYRAVHGEGWGMALIGGVKLPTGSTHRRDRFGERFETEHQLGTGSVDAIGGVALSRAFGAASVDASLLYQLAGRGAQANRLGDRAQAGIALSHRFGERGEAHHHHDDGEGEGESEEAHEAHEHRHAAFDAVIELNGEWEGRQRVAGVVDPFSGARTLWMSPGARFVSAAGWSLAGSTGLAIAQQVRASHPDNRWRFSLSVGQVF